MTTFSSDVEQWRDAIDGSECEMSTDFCLAFAEHESGGNPCSTGIITNGRIVEAGIGQIFFENAGQTVAGVTVDQLRAGCSGNSQSVADPSNVDRDAQVSSLVQQINQFAVRSQGQLAAIGETWSDDDFAKLVKMQHNLPAIPKSLLQPAEDAGSASSWDDWKAFCLGLSASQLAALDSALPRFQGEFARLFLNAETVAARAGGAAHPGGPVFSVALIPAALAWVWAMFGRLVGGGK